MNTPAATQLKRQPRPSCSVCFPKDNMIVVVGLSLVKNKVAMQWHHNTLINILQIYKQYLVLKGTLIIFLFAINAFYFYITFDAY